MLQSLLPFPAPCEPDVSLEPLLESELRQINAAGKNAELASRVHFITGVYFPHLSALCSLDRLETVVLEGVCPVLPVF